MLDDPYAQFDDWFAHAVAAGQPEPEAMAVATSTADGRSSVRFVLMRAHDERGFVFYTNRDSRKGIELAANPWASIAFRWSVTDRQVRAAGPVEMVDDDQSDAYFASRPRGSQLAAWASAQSRPVESREALERLWSETEDRFAGQEVPRPTSWGGYRVRPVEIEFWQQGEFRMHDRFQYRRLGEGWEQRRLAP
ncbi:MAG TPA: pyridoxamine 5'-phosphate oxidase [Acidimicrobiales bacterium]|nr:pyridoxamine 5'-phosphate oxidase [Acidimicrobiales bacterium]